MITAPQRALLALTWQGVGPVRMAQLLQEHGTPEAALAAGPVAWDRPALRGRRTPRVPPPVSLEEELALIERERVHLVTVVDADYPAALRTIHDPPPVLYVRGHLLPEDAAAVAIVGTRMATAHGLAVAERLGRELAAHGLTIVSGLARGIDSAAHRGALRAGGRTIAVLGSGLLRLFPPEHQALAAQIAEHGAVLSEFPLQMSPRRETFPQRNRVIAGLSLGTVVVEAPARSGALITASFALEQGREVFAVPGPAGAVGSQGPHQLLRDGARLAESAEDVLAELRGPLAACVAQMTRDQPTPVAAAAVPLAVAVPPAGTPRLTAEEAPVYARLSTQPAAVEWLVAQTGAPPGRLLRVLLALELRGLIRQMPGQQFVRVAPA